MSTNKNQEDRLQTLKEVIEEGMDAYPLEDDWLVLNEARMQNVCATCKANALKSTQAFTPTIVPEGAGSLAEAIMSGDVMAAYELVGKRPMFSLADAAADIDAIYRLRQGKQVRASAMLKELSADLNDEQLQEMMKALTSALDGTYGTEEEAVKMAIVRAVAVATKE